MMRAVAAPGTHLRFSFYSIMLSVLTIFAVNCMTACGSSGAPAPLSGNTQVTVAVTSTANDQLSEFNLVLNTMTLTSQSGKTVTLLSTPQAVEFIHVNGQLAPGFTVTVPQDLYTSGTATVGGAEFVCASYVQNSGLGSGTYNYGFTPDANVTVNLPSPITINGADTGLLIDLQVSQSVAFPNTCWNPSGGFTTWSITPTFDVTPAVFSSQPTNPQNGKVAALDGITAIASSGNSFTLAVAEGRAAPDSVTVSVGPNTVFQGIGNASGLTVGTFVDMDGALQPDSSVAASRIAVEYASAVNVVTGPVMFVAASDKVLDSLGGDQQGLNYANTYFIGGQPFNFDNAIFQISGQLTNLQSLPFVPSFTSTSMVAGQNVYLSLPALINGSNPYTELEAITLMPQTINATVTGSSVSGNFTDYSVSLASYDLFPNLAVQSNQTTLLNDPSDVEVYVDGNTELLNSQALAEGGTFRFYGLVFNDNGTLRMDCAQVSDGVDETPPSSASQRSRMEAGETWTVQRDGIGPVEKTIYSLHK
jgi:hypothetical protein